MLSLALCKSSQLFLLVGPAEAVRPMFVGLGFHVMTFGLHSMRTCCSMTDSAEKPCSADFGGSDGEACEKEIPEVKTEAEAIEKEAQEEKPEPEGVKDPQGEGEGEHTPTEPGLEDNAIKEMVVTETKNDEKIFRPQRVDKALREAKSFDEFRTKRPFKFLHVYSGPKDVLGEAIVREAKSNRLETVVLSLDKQIDKDLDLASHKNHAILMQEVGDGEWDYVHCGFPCGSFSRARHNPQPGQPPAVRCKEHIYGYPGQTATRQAEADRGTVMATQSGNLYQEQVRNCAQRRVPAASTLENPPGDQTSGSAWDLPEIKKCLKETNGEVVHYNTCAFQTKDKVRTFKPGVFAGKLDGLQGVNRVCRCPAWVTHKNLVGKAATEPAGQYPRELCEVIAKAVVNSWKRVINLEWWRFQLEEKSDQVGKLQKAWLENEERKNAGQVDTRGTKRAASVAFKIDSIDEDNLPSSSKTMPKKKVKEIHNANCVGGMRNPAYSISKLTLVRDVGLKIQGLWKEFEESHPEAAEVARNYGKPDNKFDGNLLALWKSVLKDHLAKGDDGGMTLRENYEFCSPLDGDLWSQWRNESKDPDLDLVDFIRFGAPLGMEEKIPESGIFPKALDQDDINEDPLESFEILKETKNYKSVSEQVTEAKVEIQRYVDKGFCKRVSWEWVSKEFQEGTVSKMALLLKQKPDGSTKRRIILDMRRSKGNSRASIPERIVLPRVVDVVSMLRAMWAHRPRKPPQRDADDFEFFLVDLAGAFCHFPVRKAELKHCVTPDEEDRQALLWPALLFGYRGAPLIMASHWTIGPKLVRDKVHAAAGLCG